MIGKEKGDCLINVTPSAGLTVTVVIGKLTLTISSVQSYDDNDVRFVLDQHALLGFLFTEASLRVETCNSTEACYSDFEASNHRSSLGYGLCSFLKTMK
jgi:hypothetical protein